MANEDFYLTFGSNARAWASSLKGQLDPAYKEVQRLQAAIAGLQRTSSQVSGPLTKALADALPETVAGRGTGRGSSGGGGGDDARVSSLSTKMVEDLYQASSELDHMIGSLSATFTAIRELPGTLDTAVTGTMKRIEDLQAASLRAFGQRLNGINQTTSGRGRDYQPGAGEFVTSGTGVQQGSLVHNFIQETRSLLSGRGGGLLDLRPQQSAPAISSVSAAALDKAGVDRIVAAVQAQTKALLSGRTSGSASKKTKSGKTTTVADDDSTESELEATQARLSRVNAKINAVIAALGENADAATQAILDELKSEQSQIKAEAAALERAQTGKNKRQQSADRRAAAEDDRANLEVVTKEEKAARQHALARIQQAQTFDPSTDVGRGATQYGMSELHEMAASLKTAGFGIERVSKLRQDELAQAVKAQASAYGAQYPAGTVPDALNTRVKVAPGPPLTDSVKAFLGPLNEWRASLRVLSQTAKGGADILRAAGNPNLVGGSTIHVPPGRTKGRIGYGSGNLGFEGISPLSGVADPAEVERVRKILSDPYGALSKEVRSRSVQPGGLDISSQYEGVKGQDEDAKAARLYLGSLKRATDALDKLASQYIDAKDAIADNEKFIDRATARLSTDSEKADDAAKIVSAGTQNTLLRQQLAKVPEEDSSLFDDPRFREGYNQRETQRRDSILKRRESDAEYSAFQLDPANKYIYSKAIQAGVIGTRFATNQSGQASQDLIGNIGGLRRGGDDGLGLTKEGGLSTSDQRDLDRAWQRFKGTQFKSLVVGHDVANPEQRIIKSQEFAEDDLIEARKREENSATKLAGVLARLFDGVTLRTEQLTGRPVEDPKNAAKEAARFHAQQEATTYVSPDEGAAQKQFEKEQKVAALSQRLEKAQAERTRLTEQAAQVLKEDIGGTKNQRAAILSAQDELSQAQVEHDRLAGRRRLFQDPALHDAGQFPDTAHAKGPDRDVLGYDASLGYNESLNSAVGKAEEKLRLATEKRAQLVEALNKNTTTTGPDRSQARLDELRTERAQLFDVRNAARDEGDLKENAGYHAANEELARLDAQIHALETGTGSAVDKFVALKDQITGLDSSIEKLKTDLAGAQAAVAKSGQALTEKTAKEKASTKEVLGSANAEVAALKKERADLRAAGPYQRGQIKELTAGATTADRSAAAYKGQATRYADSDPTKAAAAATNEKAARAEATALRSQAEAARAAASRITEINARLKELGAGRGSGGRGGSGGGPTAAAGDVPPDGGDNVFRQMLAELRKIAASLKGTIKVTGKNITSESGGSSSRTGGTTTRTTAPKTETQEEAAALAAIAREREAQTGIERGHQRIEQAEIRRARIERERATAASKGDLEEARRLQGLSLTMARLSDATKAEITQLNRLHTGGAAPGAIVAQQQKVYQSLSSDLEHQGVSAGGRDVAATTVLNEAGPKVDSGQLGEIKRQAQLVGQSAARESSDAAAGFFGPQGFWGRILNTTGTFVVRNFAAGAVFGLTNELQQITEQAIQTEATFVRVSSALESTGKDIGTLRTDLGNISTDYGIQLNDVYETAASLAGLFANSDDLAAGARIVAQLQAISDGALDASEAVGVLASTMSAFGGEGGGLAQGVQGVQQIADVFTVIQNNLGVNIEDTAEGVSRLAGQARQMKLSFEETSVFVAQIAKQTNQTGAGAGEQFSRILAALQTGRARTVLQQNFGSDVNDPIQSGNYGKALEALIKDWDGLSEAQKSQVASAVAGQRQAASFFALMNGGEQTLTLLAKAHDSTGAAQARMAAIMNTLNKRLAVFRTELQNLASNLVRSGILNFLGVLLVTTNTVLGVLNKILEAFNNLADHNGFLDFLRKTVTLLGGAAIGAKLLGASVTGLRQAIASRGAGASIESALGAEAGWLVPAAGAARPGSAVGAAAERRAFTNPSYSQYGVRYATAAGAPLAEGRQNAQLTRALGFGLDRTVGATTRTVASGFDKTVGSAARKIGESSGAFSKAVSTFLLRDVASLNAASSGLTTGLRSAGSGRFGLPSLVRSGSNAFDSAAQGQLARANALRTGQELGAPRIFTAGAAGTTVTNVGANAGRDAARAERLAQAASVASSATGKVASGLERVAASGAAADGALIGVAIGMAAFINYLENSKKAAEGVNNALKSIQAQNAHKTPEEIAQDNYVGPSQQLYDQIYHPGTLNAPGFAGVQGKFNAGIQGIGGIIGGGPKSWVNPFTGIDRAFGLSGSASALFGGGQSEVTGTSAATSIVKQYQTQIAGLSKGGSVTAITDIQKSANDQLDEMLKGISANDSLSQQQKLAAAGAIDQARKLITDMGSNSIADAQGLAQSQILTDDQIQKLQGALQILQSTKGRTNIGGLDLNSFYTGLSDDIGATGKLKNQLDVLFHGNLNAVDGQIQVRRVLRTEIKNLEAKLASQLTSTNVNQEDIDATKSALAAAYGQLTGVADSIQQTIQQNATTLAGLEGASGHFAGSMRTYSNALSRMHHQFLVDQGLVGAASRDIITGFRQIAAAAAKIDHDINAASRAGSYAGFAAIHGKRALTGAQREASRAQRAQEVAFFKQAAELAIQKQLAALDREIAEAVNPAVQAALQAQRAALNSRLIDTLNMGGAIPGIKRKDARKYGDAAFDFQEVEQAQNDAASAANSEAQAEESAADTARQDAAALRQARLGIAAAWADARGDAVQAARVQVQMAAAAIAAAKADLAAASTASEKSQALAALYGAQAQMIAAHAAVAQAQADLISSQFDVSIALAEAAGHTVEAVRRRLAQARAALSAALRRSGGKNTAEVNQARAGAIQAEAAVRDAKLQDELDTINFNLEMGRITQASAITALQHILQTEKLTRDQRRQLLLQIKGMKDELADSQWNFGDIKLPTPYQMRRYIEQRRNQFRGEMDAAAAGGSIHQQASAAVSGGVYNSNNTVTINIRTHMDEGRIKKVVKDAVGGNPRVRTTGARRGR